MSVHPHHDQLPSSTRRCESKQSAGPKYPTDPSGNALSGSAKRLEIYCC